MEYTCSNGICFPLFSLPHLDELDVADPHASEAAVAVELYVRVIRWTHRLITDA